MAWWNKKTKKVDKTIEPNMPLMEAYGQGTPSFLTIKGREQLAKVFNEVSEVYSPIMYSGKAFSNMNLKLYSTDIKGKTIKEITSHEVLTKLAAPNPLTNWKDFLLMYYVNKKVFGNGYIFKYQPSGFSKIQDSVFWVLPSQYVYPAAKVRPINSYHKAVKMEDFLRGYSFFYKPDIDRGVTWEPSEILHQKEPNLVLNQVFTDVLTQLLEGRSPLTTLTEPISNIRKAYEAQNVILKKRGALGMLTPKNNKDSIGAVTLTETQKKDLQKQFSKYGLGEDDWQYIISNIEMDWKPMSVPIRELMLFEGIENSMIAICNTLNFPIVLLNYLKGSTFSNVSELKKSLYQDNIIPEGKAFVAELNNFLGLPELNLKLEADFSHIPVLQEDALSEAKKDKVVVSTILDLQAAIFEGKTTIEAAIAILLNTFKFSKEVITAMLADTSKPEDTNQNTNQNTNQDE